MISGLFVSRPGIYWFALWDAYVVWAVFIVVGIECVGVAYGYGASKFAAEVQKGAGRAVPRFIQMCWSFVTPFLCSVLDCVEIKFYGAFVASTCTPSTRRLLDGVAMSVPHRSTEPARPRRRREMT